MYVTQNYMLQFTELPCILLACSPFSFMMLLLVACLVASNRGSNMITNTGMKKFIMILLLQEGQNRHLLLPVSFDAGRPHPYGGAG